MYVNRTRTTIDFLSIFLYFCRNARFCRGSNLYFDFTQLGTNRDKYREDLFSLGQLGGYCDMDHELLGKQNQHKSPLQSW